MGKRRGKNWEKLGKNFSTNDFLGKTIQLTKSITSDEFKKESKHLCMHVNAKLRKNVILKKIGA